MELKKFVGQWVEVLVWLGQRLQQGLGLELEVL